MQKSIPNPSLQSSSLLAAFLVLLLQLVIKLNQLHHKFPNGLMLLQQKASIGSKLVP
jgi:hypothetical protein